MRLAWKENCQNGVFLAYAGNSGYGLVDYELYVPKDWFCDSFETLCKQCRLPEEKVFSTKNEIVLTLVNKALGSGLFQVQWIGCDAAYGNDHSFLDGFELPDQICYFAATNAKEQVFLNQPFPEPSVDAPENIRFLAMSRCL